MVFCLYHQACRARCPGAGHRTGRNGCPRISEPTTIASVRLCGRRRPGMERRRRTARHPQAHTDPRTKPSDRSGARCSATSRLIARSKRALQGVTAAEAAHVEFTIEVVRDEPAVVDQPLLAVNVVTVHSDRVRNTMLHEGLHPAADATADIDHRARGINVENDRNERVRGFGAVVTEMCEEFARIGIATGHYCAIARRRDPLRVP